MTEVVGYHHLGLSVRDLARSVAWYRDVLGLEVGEQFDRAGFRRARLHSPDRSVTLSLTRHDVQDGEPFDERRAGMDHVALRVRRLDDVDALKRRLEQLGVDHSDVRSSTGTATITLRDPDNIQLEVIAVEPEPTAGQPDASGS